MEVNDLIGLRRLTQAIIALVFWLASAIAGAQCLRALERCSNTESPQSFPIQGRTPSETATVQRIPPTSKAPHEGVFLYDPSQGAKQVFAFAQEESNRWPEAEVRSVAARRIDGAVSVRMVLVALSQIEFLWRRDARKGNATSSQEVDWMEREAGNWSVRQLKYIRLLFDREAGSHKFQVKPVNAWTDGNQEGYGALTSAVPLSVGVESLDPAVVVLRSRMEMSPGLYKFRQGPYIDAKEAYFLIGQANAAEEAACVNIWLGDPDFGRPLLKPCKAGTALSAKELEHLDIGTSIRQTLNRILPGWQISRNRTSEACFGGSPWSPYTAWGDFDGDGREDYAVQVYRDRSLRLVLFLNKSTGLEPVMADVGEPLAEAWKELPGDYPGLDVRPAGSVYYDHGRKVSGKFPHDAVVQVYCEQSAVAYIYQRGAVRKVWISD